MSYSMHMLAAHDGSEKVIGAIIFVIIWGIAALAKWVSEQAKAQQQGKDAQQREEVRQHIAASRTAPAATTTISRGIAQRFPDVLKPPMPAPVRGPANRRVGGPQARRAAPPAPLRKPPQVARPKAVAARVPPLPPVAAAVAQAATRVIDQTPISAGAEARRKDGVSATAASVASWLKPATLRQQFILTEVFLPPVALRERGIGG